VITLLVILMVSVAIVLAFVAIAIIVHVVRGRRPLPPAPTHSDVPNIADYRRRAGDRSRR